MSQSIELHQVFFVVPGGVFNAFSSAAAWCRWCCDEAQVDPRVGGQLVVRTPGYEACGEFTAWEPARAGAVTVIRLHGDCHPGNLLWRDGPWFVDLDDCQSGPAVQDLWMLLSGDREEMEEQLADVLEGYCQFCDFNPRELQLIEALRTLRMLHHAAWLARRWEDPAFPAAFPWFGHSRYWEDLVLSLREQQAALQEPPLQLYQ